MGKIILSERQYSKLKKSLVSHSITESIGKQSNLRLINEGMTKEQRLNAELAGKKLNRILKECHDPWDDQMPGCIQKIKNEMNTLYSKEQYDEAAKYMSYWHVNNWADTLNEVLNNFLYDEDGITGPQSIEYANQFVNIFKKVGGNLSYETVIRNEEKAWGDRSFSLSWPLVDGKINDRYWPVLVKLTKDKYGAKTAKFDNGTDFIWWGQWQISRNMKSNSGYPIYLPGDKLSSSTDFKFKDGLYAGGTLDATMVIPYGSTTPITFTKMVDTYKASTTPAQTPKTPTTPAQTPKTQTPTTPAQTTKVTTTTQTPQATQKQQVQPKSYTGGGGGAPDIPV